MQKQQHLQRELQAAKRRYALLEQHLACLDKTHSDALEEEDNLEELTRHSKSALEQSRRLHKSTVAEVRYFKCHVCVWNMQLILFCRSSLFCLCLN